MHTLAVERAIAASEVAATKAAWPEVTDGLAQRASGLLTAPIRAALAAEAALRLPPLFGEEESAALTGPGSGLTGLYRNFVVLSQRGWQMIGYMIGQIEHGPPVAARFARANVALYIEAVYDGHFSLAQTAKHLKDGYEKLGGAPAFGGALTQAEVGAIEAAYSEASDRLRPHVGVRLGS